MKVRLNDRVLYRPDFGSSPQIEAGIESMELTDSPRSKYGIDREEVSLSEIKRNRVIFSLDNSRWCYSDQIDSVITEKGSFKVG